MKSTLYIKSMLYAGEKYEQCQAILKTNKTLQNFLDYLLFLLEVPHHRLRCWMRILHLFPALNSFCPFLS